MITRDKLCCLALLIGQYDCDRRWLATKLKDACNNPTVWSQNRSGGWARRDELFVDNLLSAKRFHLNHAILGEVSGCLEGLLFLFIQRRIACE